MKQIIFDVDGVILDYMSHFERYMIETCHIYPLIPFQKEADWSLKNMFPESLLKGRHIADYISDMGHDECFATIPFYDGVVKDIKKLYKKGVQMDLLTSCGNDDVMKEKRIKNLSVILPYIRTLTVLPLGASKLTHLKQYPKDTLYFDDHEKNYKDGLKAGLDARHVLIPAQKRKKKRSVRGWVQIMEAIDEKFSLTPKAENESLVNFSLC